MKRKSIRVLLAMALTASLFTACGKTETTEPVEETVETDAEAEVAEEPEEKEPVYETVTYSVLVASTNEDGTYTAYDADHTYTLTLSEDLAEDQRALVVDGAAIAVSTEVEVAEDAAGEDAESDEAGETAESDEADAASEETDGADAVSEEADTADAAGEENTGETPISVLVTAVAAVSEEETAELTSATFEKIHGFAVDHSIIANMYAKQSVNVRSGPSADYEQVGKLSFGQEVSVTGQADTGWYQIELDGQTGYVSNNYIQTEKPSTQTASTGGSGSGSTGSASTGASTGSTGAASSGRDYQAEYRAAVAAGDIALAKSILEESAGVAPGTIGGGSGSGGSSSSGAATTTEKSTSLSTAFVDYLNSERAAAGLSELNWSDSMASTALERAEEIVDDFSHSGARNCSGEDITKTSDGSVSHWYENFYNSPTHRVDMLGNYNNVAAAYCQVGNTYYVVVLFGY
ncbi:MAG: SH3 domain-containing protein [Eubacteriales bacterium]|nr:SH3 domain-containing protein [Eubacteriales bacterium]